MKFIARAACAIALAAAASAAIAKDLRPDQVRRARVSYHDLDLSRREGVAELDLRVKRAIRRVCRSNLSGLWARSQERGCTKEAKKDAGRQMAAAIEHARDTPKSPR
jgi:UrcA family protein